MRNIYGSLVGSRLVVKTGGDTFGGVLATATRKLLTFDDVVDMDNKAAAVDGHLVVPAAAVDWVQVLG